MEKEARICHITIISEKLKVRHKQHFTFERQLCPTQVNPPPS